MGGRAGSCCSSHWPQPWKRGMKRGIHTREKHACAYFFVHSEGLGLGLGLYLGICDSQGHNEGSKVKGYRTAIDHLIWVSSRGYAAARAAVSARPLCADEMSPVPEASVGSFKL